MVDLRLAITLSDTVRFYVAYLTTYCSRTAERITGYLVGGISPFGTRQKLPVVMEESILKFEEILINAGQRGTMLKMAPRDIEKAVVVKVASIAKLQK